MSRILFFWLLLALAVNPVLAADLAGQSADRLTRVLQSHSLRVCIWPDYYGITYRNPKTQQLTGIDIDLARQLAQDLGSGVRVTFVDSSFARLIEDITADRCDIAMFAIGITPARAEKLRFTRPHLQSDIYAVTTRSNRRIKEWADIDQPGVVVAVAKGTYHEPVMRQRLRQAKLVALDTPFAREQEVESGRADVFMTDYPYSQRMLANVDWARLVSPPGVFHLTPYAYAMQPGDDRWHERVEQFVRDIKSDGRLLDAGRRNHLEPIVNLKN
ncbi:amino acid ABC transporter substrate-binding protein [Desulfopila sp. IMCC35006]|uniref:ABC transporter substrate-binding protein n=1 Tax=Desulfopila sp. IMCC35006 TaxID=2569542 RepID=UPI0010AC635B|nr:ABC transporter substrate-binding protein [Desulfopila sp. IMCC35006]TKB23860.1 amino acid ABC transporter substrate-binding protein [Desulfopila sp. IMCC35006]